MADQKASFNKVLKQLQTMSDDIKLLTASIRDTNTQINHIIQLSNEQATVFAKKIQEILQYLQQQLPAMLAGQSTLQSKLDMQFDTTKKSKKSVTQCL